MKAIYSTTAALAMFALFSCNDSRPGQNTTASGTELSDNTVNSDMENNRQPADVDTIVSPGSNAVDHKEGRTDPTTNIDNVSRTQTGTGVDPNMKGQSDTHGRDTKAGNK